MHWGKLDSSYAACSLGHTQSPIYIAHAKPADLPTLKLDYKVIPLDIINNGHTIQVNYTSGSTLTVGDKTYTLKQFHFHHPSEEHVNGKGFPLVAHLVHADADWHLAVVAVLLEQGNANPLIDALWKNIPSERDKPQDIPSVSVNVQDSLPAEHSYLTYAGSLTTPPCSEGVTWYVLKSHAAVSAEPALLVLFLISRFRNTRLQSRYEPKVCQQLTLFRPDHEQGTFARQSASPDWRPGSGQAARPPNARSGQALLPWHLHQR